MNHNLAFLLLAVAVLTLGIAGGCDTPPDSGTDSAATQDAPQQDVLMDAKDDMPGQEDQAGDFFDTADPDTTNADNTQPDGSADAGDEQWTLTSTAFADGGTIGAPHVCTGLGEPGVSPPLTWKNTPANAVALAVTVVDIDANDFTHWVIWNIPVSMNGLPENVGPMPLTDYLALQGINDFGINGYGGPCPPPNGPHHYVFTLHALDEELTTSSRAPKGTAREDVLAHTIDSVSITAVYENTP